LSSETTAAAEHSLALAGLVFPAPIRSFTINNQPISQLPTVPQTLSPDLSRRSSFIFWLPALAIVVVSSPRLSAADKIRPILNNIARFAPELTLAETIIASGSLALAACPR
jgi:hypothetical protein